MASPLHLFTFLRVIFLLATFCVIVINTSSSIQPLCHENESSALMQFKQSISINKSASYDPSGYAKVASWKPEGEGNCCSWDGITCHGDTGHVIGLDLSSSLLYGSINSSSSLFHLVHLRRLNLADNDFNHSQIPSAVGLLSRLTYLNLSLSSFAGQIPIEISQLNKLVSLELSVNPLLKLQKPGLASLVHNLTNLEELHLSQVNISSVVPEILAKIPSLKSLLLKDCGLHGEFPAAIFNLPNLQFLSIRYNQELSGYLPEFHRRSPLKLLRLAGTSFSGELPNSIGNLDSLNTLDISECNLSGSIPSSIGNLTQLVYLSLQYNLLQGPIPDSIAKLVNLKVFYMGRNNLSGRVKLGMFLTLKCLTELQLSDNPLTLLSDSNYTNATLPKLTHLELASCNLNEFPDFLRYQDSLEYLNLENNKIQGLVPKWIWNMSTETLQVMFVSQNFLTGFDQPPAVCRWSRLSILDLSFNMLHGSLPIPPSSTYSYDISNNKLSGEIPPLICNLTSLHALEFSYNNLSGMIPQCLGSLSSSLSLLNLKSNNFYGPIPQIYNNRSRLKMISLGQNQLQGPVPRSLINCKLLEILDLGNNQINDIFPFWLGTHLPELKVLILGYNRFHGVIQKHHPESSSALFPKLLIIDLSHNGFTGKLPSDYFHNWEAMKTFDVKKSRYMQAIIHLTTPGGYEMTEYYNYSMTLTNKGVQTKFLQILNIFTAIDLSSNKFEGEISESIGILKGLLMLNLSNNNLIGHIPSSLRNLTELESLDFSQNNLSGEIPQELTHLTFLGTFNVSHNHLTGRIPHGRQFDTFQNSSYEGNSGLCGEPLSKKCGNSEASPPPPSSKFEQHDDHSWFSIDKTDWIVICMGYGGGLVVGLIIGHTLTTRYHEWFVSTFGRNQKNQRRKKKSGRRS